MILKTFKISFLCTLAHAQTVQDSIDQSEYDDYGRRVYKVSTDVKDYNSLEESVHYEANTGF